MLAGGPARPFGGTLASVPCGAQSAAANRTTGATVDIEVHGESPVEDPPPVGRLPWYRRRDSRAVAIAAVLGLACGFAVATARDDRRDVTAAAQASSSPSAPAPSPTEAADALLTPQMASRMIDQVRVYNTTEPATVEVSDVVLMAELRTNLTRLDTPHAYPPGDYRLQLICLGEGQVWALFRIGVDESYVDMDCHDDHVLVSQLLLTAKSTGQRTVTVVTDSPAGLAIGYQTLRTLAP